MHPFRRTLLHALGALVLLVQTAVAQAHAGRDTLNILDAQGRKQGWWQVTAPKVEKPRIIARRERKEGEA